MANFMDSFETKPRHTLVQRRGRRAVGWLPVLLLVAFGVNCRDVDRHQVLSFFFDGVPPLPGAKTGGPEPNEGGLEARRGRPEPTWFVHEPQSDCARCHGERKERGFSGQVHLTMPVPQLCYGCHQPPSSDQGWIHGPVAAGRCVLCHEPHRSANAALLKRPIPTLCTQCHSQLASIENHERASYALCLDCHAGHASPAKHLLRAGPLLRALRSGRSEPTGDPEFDATVASDRAALRQGVSLGQALDLAAQSAGQGETRKARAYIMAARMEGSPSEADRSRMADLVKAIDDSEKAQALGEQQARRERAKLMAQLYYESLTAYKDGHLVEAYAGFAQVADSDVVPEPIKKAVQGYIRDIRQRTGLENDARP
jgi:predicted CXXCH cytochrome family protein